LAQNAILNEEEFCKKHLFSSICIVNCQFLFLENYLEDCIGQAPGRKEARQKFKGNEQVKHVGSPKPYLVQSLKVSRPLPKLTQIFMGKRPTKK